MIKQKKCSIIIRTKNEERWITQCLNSVFNQNYKNYEVIIVDNESSDLTINKAKKFPIKRVVKIKNYLPGYALNAGISKSKGDYIVCLSGHCIPTNKNWLSNLVEALEENDEFAGVYGRQEPMSFTSPADKRDLILLFGLDRKIQKKDSFFHNANSILHRYLWKKFPFDENVTNIEDRVWGNKMVNEGYKLVYEPSASVYHYHGIHHNGDMERCNNVVKIIESIKSNNDKSLSKILETIKIFAIIPHKGPDNMIGEHSQLGITIKSAQKSKYISKIIVNTDNTLTAKTAKKYGAEVPYIRQKELTLDYVSTEKVITDTLIYLEKKKFLPDLIVYLENTFPLRPSDLIDIMIEKILTTGLDTLVAGRKENSAIWLENSLGEYSRVDSGDGPRIYKENLYTTHKGVALITYADSIRSGSLYGIKIGVHPIDSPVVTFEVRNKASRKVASTLLDLKN